jgi:hypothetical protein
MYVLCTFGLNSPVRKSEAVSNYDTYMATLD